MFVILVCMFVYLLTNTHCNNKTRYYHIHICIIRLYIYSQIPLQGEHEKINCENYDKCKEIISSRYMPNYS